MHLYSADIRSVILNSAYPPQVNLFTSIPRATERSFDILFQGCELDHNCNTAYPHLQEVFYQIHLHDYNQLAFIYGNLISTTESIRLFYSIECGEDMAYTSQHDIETSVQGLPPQIQPAFLNFGLNRYSICQFWRMKPEPAEQKEPVRSTIPTLILQGEYDPVTPPTNGLLAAQTLSNSYFFLFPGVGHGVSSSTNCPTDIMNSFLANPAVKPDASCISTMAEPFFT